MNEDLKKHTSIILNQLDRELENITQQKAENSDNMLESLLELDILDSTLNEVRLCVQEIKTITSNIKAALEDETP